MKNRLVNKIVFIIALFVTQIAFAQNAAIRTPKFTPEQKAEKITVHLKQQLSLSDDQSEKIKSVYLDHLQKMQGKEEKRKVSRQELENNLSQILTKDQFEKFKSMESQRRDQMRARRDQKTQPSPADQTNPDSQPAEQK